MRQYNGNILKYVNDIELIRYGYREMVVKLIGDDIIIICMPDEFQEYSPGNKRIYVYANSEPYKRKNIYDPLKLREFIRIKSGNTGTAAGGVKPERR